MTDQRVIKTYVWHGVQCYFVSTIERDSSAECDPSRFNETIVWRFDWDANKRGEMVFQDGGCQGDITSHLETCRRIFEGGEFWKSQ